MAFYLVRARPIEPLLPDLRKRLDSGEIKRMRPFGTALHGGLEEARVESQGWAIWEEEDYCSPPLEQERAAVLDTYFTDLQVEKVVPGKGWDRIERLGRLWKDRRPG